MKKRICANCDFYWERDTWCNLKEEEMRPNDYCHHHKFIEGD